MNRNSLSTGFTLIEILLAVLVLGVGMLTLVGAMTASINGERHITNTIRAASVGECANAHFDLMAEDGLTKLYRSVSGPKTREIPPDGEVLTYPEDDRYSYRYRMTPVTDLPETYRVEIRVFHHYARLATAKPGGDVYTEDDLLAFSMEVFKVAR